MQTSLRRYQDVEDQAGALTNHIKDMGQQKLGLEQKIEELNAKLIEAGVAEAEKIAKLQKRVADVQRSHALSEQESATNASALEEIKTRLEKTRKQKTQLKEQA